MPLPELTPFLAKRIDKIMKECIRESDGWGSIVDVIGNAVEQNLFGPDPGNVDIDPIFKRIRVLKRVGRIETTGDGRGQYRFK